jgi:hypothetical protein
MANILDIYSQYKIVPFLQLHQLRVAAVAKQICDSLKVPVDTDGVVVAALLHDMGNILKFDFSRFPDVFQPEGITYWQSVQAEYRAKYGPDEHDATLAIAEELHVPSRVIGYIKAVGFSNVPSTLADPSIEKKICCYSDQRVAPNGVVSIRQRLEEGAKRYALHPTRAKLLSHQGRSAEGLLEMEQQIFRRSTILPDQVGDETVAPIIEELKNVDISNVV